MKWKISLIVAVLLGGLAGAWVKNLPGFVILAYDKTTYEMRLWVAATFVLMAIGFAFIVVVLVRFIFNKCAQAWGWHDGRKERKAKKKYFDGMLAFSEGRWKDAEDAMRFAAERSDDKLTGYLLAARAAQNLKSQERRDEYLRLAHQAEPQAGFAIGLTQAQLQIQHGQLEQALASLKQLKNHNPKHPFVLTLLLSIYQKLGDWKAVLDLIPQLEKLKVKTATELHELKTKTLRHLLLELAHADDRERFDNLWLKLSNGERKNHDNQLSYCEGLILLNRHKEALKILTPLVKLPILQAIPVYVKVEADDPVKQFNTLERVISDLQKDATAYHHMLGILAFRAQLWGKAKDFFSSAIKNAPGLESFYYLAKTYEALNDVESSSRIYRAGMEFSEAGENFMVLEGANALAFKPQEFKRLE